MGSTAGYSLSSVSEAASLSALLATASNIPAASAAAAIGTSDEAMTGILSVQRQQLRARIEQLEREAAAHRRSDAPTSREYFSACLTVSSLAGCSRPLKLSCKVCGQTTWSCMPS